MPKNFSSPKTYVSCQRAKYQLITDIIKFQGLGVKVSFTILRNFDMVRTIGLFGLC